MEHQFATRVFSGMLALAMSGVLAVAPVHAEGQGRKGIYQPTLKATVWILSRRGDRLASGTGSLIDKKHRLVVTNYHVVGEEKQVRVVFPDFANGKLIAERSHYWGLVARSRFIPGKVLATESKRDLAIIQLETVPERAQALRLAQEGVGPGDQVHSIGNPGKSDALWEYTSGTVRQVYHKKWRVRDGETIHEFEAKVVETQSPTNPGDSGGPLVNDRGELVGVTQGYASDAQLVSLFIDASEVRKFWANDKRLAKVSRPPARGDTEDRTKPGTEKPADLEQAAASKLRLAKALADEGRLERAKDNYEKIIAAYPETKAAAEAKVLLDKLNK